MYTAKKYSLNSEDIQKKMCFTSSSPKEMMQLTSAWWYGCFPKMDKCPKVQLSGGRYEVNYELCLVFVSQKMTAFL